MVATTGRATLAAALLGLCVTTHPGQASADVIDELGRRLSALSGETDQLVQGIGRPDQLGRDSADRAARRLIDGQVAFGVGSYSDAALILYDYVERYPKSRSYPEALYYLSESLFQKGDYVASRAYFTELVRNHSRSAFYQQGLERLIELSLKLDDDSDVELWLGALDGVPAGQRRASVPYVRGKYAFFSDDYDTALAQFSQVPADSEYRFQAQYFTGAAHIAKGDLARATRAYQSLTQTEPRTDDDRRVVELAWMALGRLFYERDQPSQAIDHYLRISRKSDLFDEALYEVAWVYVKAGRFDQALRALELLALADPTSSRLPEVKILEGNLRIRKAQALETDRTGNPLEEYNAAVGNVERMRATFRPSFDELENVMAQDIDARLFMEQITGRASTTFDTRAVLPEIAAGWIREEPEVQRIMDVEVDLAQIEQEIADTERSIVRLEAALSSDSRVNIFPTLADKRTRSTEILEDVFSLRQQLATHERALVRRHVSPAAAGELDRLQAARQDIARQLAALPHGGMAYGDRIEASRADYVELDKEASQVRVIIESTQATLVALEKFLADEGGAGLSPEDLVEVRRQLDELRAEVSSLRGDLEAVRREAVMARDTAGTGDEGAVAARDLRARLRQALDDEHRAMRRIAEQVGGSDRVKLDQIASLTRTANSVTVKLDEMNKAIDAVVDVALEEVFADLEEQKARLSAYRQEFRIYENESRELGGAILAASFGAVKERFYDVLIRSDIGVIDVTWSQKEHADEMSQRLILDRQRELRTLQEDFRDILEEERLERQRQQAAEEGAQ